MRGLGLLLLFLAALNLIVFMEPPQPGEEDGQPPRAAPVEPKPVERSGAAADWLATTLARPLFTVGRRPERIEAEPVAERPGPPRLTGIVVAASTRWALFALPGALRSVIVAEGDRVELFEVVAIQAGAVELNGPGGRLTLSPTTDAGLRADLEAARPLTALIAPLQRELETETDQ